MAIIRYLGSKYLIADKILRFIPKGGNPYTEPFSGALGLFIKKTWIDKREVINDINEDLIHMFRIIRDNPIEFAHKIMFSPYSDIEFKECINKIKNRKFKDDIDRARCVYVSYKYSYGGTGEQFGRNAISKDKMKMLEEIIKASERLLKVEMTSMDFREFIKIYDRKEAVHYLDPPYIDSYNSYKSDGMERDNIKKMYEDIIEIMNKGKGKFILSTYENDIINNLSKKYVAIKFKRKEKVYRERVKYVNELIIVPKEILRK